MYFILAGILFILSLIEIINSKFKILSLKIGITVIFIILAFNRWTVDLENYLRIFRKVDHYLVQGGYEYLFLLSLKASKIISDNFLFFQILYSLFISIALYILLKRKCLYPSLALSIYYFFPLYPNIVQIRQNLAFACFYIYLVINSKYSYIFLIISCFFHNSMFILLPIIFFKSKKITLKRIVKINLCFTLIILFNIFGVEYFFSKILILLDLKRYIGSSLSQKTLIGDLYMIFPFWLTYNFILIYFLKNKQSNTKLIKSIEYSYIIFILILFYRDFTRFSWNFYLLYIIYFLNNFIYLKNKFKMYCIYILIYTISILIFYQQFLLINKGEYFKTIEQTITNNIIIGDE